MNCISHSFIEDLLQQHDVAGASIAICSGNSPNGTETIQVGLAHKASNTPIDAACRFQMASLSKTIAVAFALEFLRKHGISIDSKVNQLLADYNSPFRLEPEPGKPQGYAQDTQIRHLMNHTALGMHYVVGHPLGQCPSSLHLARDLKSFKPPGKQFHYSGGGFIVLQHILELVGGASVEPLMGDFLTSTGLEDFAFTPNPEAHYATGYRDDGSPIPGGRLSFPPLAAGGECAPRSMAAFLSHLPVAYHNVGGSGGIHHDTAVQMLFPERDKGSMDFMGASMGLGVFVTDSADNRLALHQAANDGFRGLFIMCFKGPDQGKGFVICTNGDNNATVLNCLLARHLMKDWHGVSFSSAHFNPQGLAQEEIVNRGIKGMILDHLEPCLPTLPRHKGPLDPLSHLNRAQQAFVRGCSDQSFSRASNLFLNTIPTFDPNEFGPEGKVMDSWESKRHNPQNFEWVEFTLQSMASFDLLHISTMYHLGNQCEAIALEIKTPEGDYRPLLNKTTIKGHSSHWFQLPPTAPNSPPTLRLRGYPDGGISRLGLYARAELKPHQIYEGAYSNKIKKPNKPRQSDPKEVTITWNDIPSGDWVEVSSAALGGHIISCSDEHYSPAHRILATSSPEGMHDGFETKRSRGDHFEEVVVGVTMEIPISTLEFDFTYFINNNPREIEVMVALDDGWQPLIAKTNIKPWQGQRLLLSCPPTHAKKIRLRLFPDGGINRFRAFGYKP